MKEGEIYVKTAPSNEFVFFIVDRTNSDGIHRKLFWIHRSSKTINCKEDEMVYFSSKSQEYNFLESCALVESVAHQREIILNIFIAQKFILRSNW